MKWQDVAEQLLAEVEAERAAAPVPAEKPKAVRGYSAAKGGRRLGGWKTTGESANQAIRRDHPWLRQRSRDAVVNIPHAKKGIETLVMDIVGTGIIPRIEVIKGYGADGRALVDKGLSAQATRNWQRFTEDGVSGSDLDTYGQQSLAVNGWLQSGSVFAVARSRRPGDGLLIPGQIQLLEDDFCPVTLNEDLTGDGKEASGSIVQGVEFDQIGQRRAYWFHRSHPGGSGKAGAVSRGELVRVPAERVAHLYRAERPAQVRGVPALATALIKLKELARYEEAALVNLQAASSLAAFVHGDRTPFANATNAATADEGGLPVTEFAPGMVVDLGDAQVTLNHPQAITGHAEYISTQLHEVAAAIGVTYEKLTGDLSRVNYSSLRGGLLTYRRLVEYLQHRIMVPLFCRPTWRWFLGWSIAAGLLPEEGAGLQYKVTWQPPAFQSVDPLKDAMADRANMRNGTKSPQDIVEQRTGAAFEDKIAEIAKAHELWDEAGIVSDGDPRKTTQAGQPRLGEEDDETSGSEADGRGLASVG